jgi:hypothetical protein
MLAARRNGVGRSANPEMYIRIIAMPLVIRKEQMAALQLDTDIRWYEGQLADLYPSFAAASFEQRRGWIQGGIRRAAAAGLQRPEFFHFLCFEQTFSPDCLENASFDWARRILAEPGKPSADRAKRLRHESIRHLLEMEAQEQQEEEARAAAAVEAGQEQALADSDR